MFKALLLFIALLLFSTSQFATADDKIKIGVSTALTGNAASYGNDLRRALEFANKRLAGGRYEFVIEDDKCNARDAVSAARRFVDVLRLRYVIGFACSSTILGTASIYEKAGVLAMVISASAADISHSGTYIYRTWPSDAAAGRKLFEFIASRHRKVGVISEQTDFSQGLLRSLESQNADKKIEIQNENYLTESTDYRSLILKLRRRGVEALFINSQTELTFMAVLKQVREAGWDVPIYSAYLAGTPGVREQIPQLIEGTIYVDLPGPEQTFTVEGKSLYDEFVKEYGPMKSIEVMFASVYEGFRALHQAIESGKEPRSYLDSAKFKGIFGDWSFNQDGDVQGLEFVIQTIRNGKPEPVTVTKEK